MKSKKVIFQNLLKVSLKMKRRIFLKFVLKCGRGKIEALLNDDFFESLLKIGFKTRWPVEKYGCRKSEKTNFSKFTQNCLQNAAEEKSKR